VVRVIGAVVAATGAAGGGAVDGGVGVGGLESARDEVDDEGIRGEQGGVMDGEDAVLEEVIERVL